MWIPEKARLLTRRWIVDVPSKMVQLVELIEYTLLTGSADECLPFVHRPVRCAQVATFNVKLCCTVPALLMAVMVMA